MKFNKKLKFLRKADDEQTLSRRVNIIFKVERNLYKFEMSEQGSGQNGKKAGKKKLENDFQPSNER